MLGRTHCLPLRFVFHVRCCVSDVGYKRADAFVIFEERELGKRFLHVSDQVLVQCQRLVLIKSSVFYFCRRALRHARVDGRQGVTQVGSPRQKLLFPRLHFLGQDKRSISPLVWFLTEPFNCATHGVHSVSDQLWIPLGMYFWIRCQPQHVEMP